MLLFPQLPELVIAQRPAVRLDQPRVYGDTLVDGKAPLLELAQDLGVDFIHDLF